MGERGGRVKEWERERYRENLGLKESSYLDRDLREIEREREMGREGDQKRDTHRVFCLKNQALTLTETSGR